MPAQHCLRHWSGFLIDPLPELPLGPARPAPDLQPEGSEAHPGEQQPQLAQRSHEEEAEAVGPETEGEKLEADLSSVSSVELLALTLPLKHPKLEVGFSGL